jgi:serine/threonine protein kinase
MAVPDALVGRSAIERELGRGDMAVVYLARDLRYDRPVALKVLLGELTPAASDVVYFPINVRTHD